MPIQEDQCGSLWLNILCVLYDMDQHVDQYQRHTVQSLLIQDMEGSGRWADNRWSERGWSWGVAEWEVKKNQK